MRSRVFVVLALLVTALAVGGMAISLETMIGTDPSATVAVVWDVSSNFSVAAAFGIGGFNSTLQTESTTVQSPSYTLGLNATYRFLPNTSSVRPYLGIGASLSFAEEEVAPFLEAFVGARIAMTPSIYSFGELAVALDVSDIVDSYWKARLGVGFHLRF